MRVNLQHCGNRVARASAQRRPARPYRTGNRLPRSSSVVEYEAGPGMTTSDFSTGGSSAEVIELLPTPTATLRLSDVWAYRELLFFLVWRDIRVKYKQTALGILWALL